MKKLCYAATLCVVLATCVAACVMCGKSEPTFKTRGIIVFWDDVKNPARLDWPALAADAGITTISIFADQTIRETKEYKDIIAECRKRGMDVEFQEHAMSQLLPRELFDEHPEYFRMNRDGVRTNDLNCCPSSAEALEIIAENAKTMAKRNVPTDNKYYFWMDDGGDRCYCDKCRLLNDSDQALIIENRIIESLREVNPKAMLAHLSYHNTFEAPSTIKPAEGIFLEFAPFYRRWDMPLRNRDAIREGSKVTHGEYLDALSRNLEVFPVETAEVLEYWLDVSLFSGWRKPAVKLPWNKEVFLDDIDTYAKMGIRHITTFGAYIDADYYDAYGDVGFVKEYGEGLRNYMAE